jgi:hypothetical protein
VPKDKKIHNFSHANFPTESDLEAAPRGASGGLHELIVWVGTFTFSEIQKILQKSLRYK